MSKIHVLLESCGLLLGLACAMAAYSECRGAALIGKNGGTTVGTITAVEAESNEFGGFFRPVVQFKDTHQVSHTFRGKYAEVSPVVGSQPRVVYSVADASFAALENEGYESHVGAGIVGAFVFIVVFGFHLLVRFADEHDRRRATAEAGPSKRSTRSTVPERQ